MKINIRQNIVTLTGEPLPKTESDKTPITVGDVLINCCMMAPKNPQEPYSATDHVSRYMLATKVRQMQMSPDQDGNVEVEAQMAAALIEDVRRAYLPLVAGQMIPVLNGKN